MGSGNKDKKRRRAAGLPVEPDDNPGKMPQAKRGAPLPPVPGVVFDIEPDADQIFQDSVRQWDERLLDFEDEMEGVVGPAPKAARTGPVEIDLHRLTLEEALWRVDAELDAALGRAHAVTFKIITGKGLHSGPSGGVLMREDWLPDYVRRANAGGIERVLV